MWPRSCAKPSETSIAALAMPRSRSPSSTRGSGWCRRRAAAALPGVVQGIGGAAQLAGDPDVVARPRAAARVRQAGGHFAEDRHAERERPARGVAADQVHVEAPGQGVEALGELGEPGLVGRRQRDRQRRPARRGARRRHVGKIHRQRLVPEQARVGAALEVAALQQHVGRHRQRGAGLGHEQRGVVAHAEQRVARGPREVALDDLELGRHRRPQAGCFLRPTSSGRSPPASFSSTPLTNLWPPVPP